VVARAGLLRLATLAVLWGSSFLWIKLALLSFAPIQITLVRLILGAAVLLGWLSLRGERVPRGVGLWLHLFAAAAVANVAPYFLFAFGEQQVDSSVAGMLNATTPLWTVLLAVVVRQERRPSAFKSTGLIVGFVGTLLIFAPWEVGSQFSTLGAVACLLAALSYAVSYVYMTRFLASRDLSPVQLSAGQLTAAAAITALGTPFLGGGKAPDWNASAVLALATLGILSTGVAYVVNYRLIRDDGATAASVATYLLPVVAVLLGAAVLSELPALHAIAGLAVVLLGVALARRSTATTETTETTPTL
jgi:drug/metabolite transporter (DMT)-like permease